MRGKREERKTMTPNEYQRAAMRTAPQKLSLAEAALGMATEASEAADVLKKHLFQGHPLDTEKLKKEMGDALWYMAYVCHMVDGLDLEGVMEDNIKKLSVRFPNGFTPEASMARADEDEDKAENGLVIVGNVKEHPDIARGQRLEDNYAQNEPPIADEEYRPCPFCGSDNVDLECDEGIWYVCCQDCAARGSNAYMPENAITMWNSHIAKGGGK